MRETASGTLVTVRKYRPDDVDELFAAAAESIPDLAPWETWCHPGYSHNEAAGYVNWWLDAWADGKAYYFVVEDLETGEFLGSCGLSDLLIEHQRAGLGFWIRSSRTGRGFATEAAQIVTHLAFEDPGLERLELPSGPTDTAVYCLLRSQEHRDPLKTQSTA